MSLDDLNIDVINSHKRRPVTVAKNSATPANVAALNLLLAKLARWEESNPAYQEMLAAAEAKVTGQGAG